MDIVAGPFKTKAQSERARKQRKAKEAFVSIWVGEVKAWYLFSRIRGRK